MTAAYVVALSERRTFGIWSIAHGGSPYEEHPATEARLKNALRRVDGLHRAQPSGGMTLGVGVVLDF
jgi:hypothetical protein